MVFWSSSETTTDVSEALREFDRALEREINERLAGLKFDSRWTGWEWAFIAMIFSPEFIDLYTERVRRSNVNKVLEFRLIIQHDEFLAGPFNTRLALYSGQLQRAIGLMAKWKMTEVDRNLLHDVVTQAQAALTRTQ